MYQVIYTSQATVPLTDGDLTSLLLQSRRWNEQEGITGVLLYDHEQFVQVLEGKKAVVDALYKCIQQDVRHYNVTLLTYGQIAAPYFAQWSMAFHVATPEHIVKVRGYFDPERPLRPWDHNTLDEQVFDLIREFVHPSDEQQGQW